LSIPFWHLFYAQKQIFPFYSSKKPFYPIFDQTGFSQKSHEGLSRNPWQCDFVQVRYAVTVAFFLCDYVFFVPEVMTFSTG